MENNNSTLPRWKIRSEIDELKDRLKAERMENVALCERHNKELNAAISMHNDKVAVADRAVELASVLAACLAFLASEGPLLVGLAVQDAMDPFLVVTSILLSLTIALGAYGHVRDALWSEGE
jgi:hypothetical protein